MPESPLERSKRIYLYFRGIYAEEVRSTEERGEMTAEAFSRAGIIEVLAVRDPQLTRSEHAEKPRSRGAVIDHLGRLLTR